MSPQRECLAPLLNLIRLPHRLASVASIVATTFALFALLFLALSDTLQAAGIQPVRPSTSRLQAPPNCVEQVVNGGFEKTGVGWSSAAGASLFTYATDEFASGRRSLLLGITGSSNITATFGVEQLIQLPGESSSIAFSFAYQVLVSGGSDAGDQAYLTIYDADTNQLLAMLVLSPTNDAWVTGRYDLTPLAGKNIRLAFSAQNDGEPGRLAMRVDDVSILACLPVKEFALTPLPMPTSPPVMPAPLILTPLPSPQPSATVPPPASAPPVTSTLPPAQSQAPIAGQSSGTIAPGSISSLDACSCSSSLYTCSDFSSWSVAQACFTHCQVTAGYDIHNLDPDRDGIACELELQDVASLTDTSAPQSMPSSLTQTTALTPAVSVGVSRPQYPRRPSYLRPISQQPHQQPSRQPRFRLQQRC